MDGVLLGQQLINGLVIGLGYALVAIGISLTFRVLDAVNFAHGDLYMLGGYFTYLVLQGLGLPYWLAGLVAVALTAATGWLIFRLVGRVLLSDHMNTLLATFALSLMIGNLVNVLLSGKSRPLSSPFTTPLLLGPFVVTGQRAVLIAVSVVLIAAIHLWLQRSVLGKQIMAVAENLSGARVIGINVTRIYLLVFVGGAALAGLTGALLAPITQVSALSGISALVKAFVVMVIGGSGNVLGAALGGVGLGLVESLAATYISSAWKDVFGYALLIIVLLLRRPGIAAAVREGLRPQSSAGGPRWWDGRVGASVRYGLLAAALLAPLLLNTPYLRTMLILTSIYMLLAIGLDLIMGYVGIISFGHAAFFAIGAYTTGLLTERLGWSLLAGMVPAVLMAALGSLVIGLASIRISGVYFALATLGFAEIVRLVVLNWTDLTHGPMGLLLPTGQLHLIGNIPLHSDLIYYYVVMAGVLLAFYLVSRLRSLWLGRAFLAIRENEPLAASLSINPVPYKIGAFCLAGALAALAGGFYGHYYAVVTPATADLHYTAVALLMVMVGGRGSPLGPLLGAVVFAVVPELIRMAGTWSDLVFGAILFVVVLLAPGGLGAALDRLGAGRRTEGVS